MAERDFYIVDVFAERPHSGNQLAVVIARGDESAAEMQSIAREFNFSETTFVGSAGTSLAGGSAIGGPSPVPVRIFTPAEELSFAGHPTLGTSWVVRHRLSGGLRPPQWSDGARGEIILAEKVGPIRTWLTGANGEETLWMRQNPPEFFEEEFDAADVARTLGLEPSNIDPSYPVQVVSTGLPFVIVPVISVEAVARARESVAGAREVAGEAREGQRSTGQDPGMYLVFARGSVDSGNDLHCRMFASGHGVPEDPATGSANGCLAAYLVRHRYLDSDGVDVRVEQGYEMGRPSILYLSAELGDQIRIDVGGKVQLVATGRMA